MPVHDLTEVLKRLHGEAEQVLVGKEGTERRAREDDRATDERYLRGLDACEELLVRIDPSSSEVVLTGDQSAAVVAEWLDMPQLDLAELHRGLEHPLTARRLADPEIKVVVNSDLALA